MNIVNFKHTVIAFLPILVVPVLLCAQDADVSPKLRLAQSFEQAGEWDRAVALYEQLLQNDPQSYVLFDGLRRGYTQLKKYDKAINLVKQRLTLQGGDIALQAILGGLYYLSGDSKKADSLWNVVIEGDPKNPTRYRLVASQMIEHRQYDQAIRIYLAAREATPQEEQFAEELAALYGALQQYEAATQEYIRVLRSKPQQLGYVQSRIASFTGREDGRKAAINVVRKEVQRVTNDLGLHTLLAWLYMEGKDYESALVEYRTIDRLGKANGAELFQFAQRASQERAHLVAAKAFRELIERSPNQQILPHARFGYARAIEELSVETDTVARVHGSLQVAAEGPVSETRPSFQGASNLYEALVADYPNSEIAMQAFYRIGIVRYNRFFDLDGALSAFDRVRTLPFNPTLTYEAMLTIGDVHVARNDLIRARAEYSSLVQKGIEHYRERILFKLAELDYFEGKFDSALVKLNGITSKLDTDLANDALQLLYFIQENKMTSLAALAEFATSDLLMRQRKYSEALSRFLQIKQTYPTAPLLDDGMMKIAELQLLLHRTGEALTVLTQVATAMPASILRDKAQMRLGEVYEEILNNKAKAIEAYEQILVKYPTSLYVEEARKRIRLLRGDPI